MTKISNFFMTMTSTFNVRVLAIAMKLIIILLPPAKTIRYILPVSRQLIMKVEKNVHN